MKTLLTSAACLLAVAALSLQAADEKPEAAGPKCPVSGAACKKDFAADYKGGKVYFCCDNCPKAFAKDTAKFANKANLQLVQTKQAEQLKCPLTGGPAKDENSVAINGAKVSFCCGNCLAKVKKTEGDEQLELVLNDKAFEKGFKVAKEKK
jgi:YHS domain-containing protein